jgi:hypothetical protein
MALLGLLVTLVVAAQSAPSLRPGEPTPADIAAAVARVPRFTPDRFARLTPSAREAFTRINCQVPQPSLTAGPQNVVEGEFAAKGQRDWAALCSDGTTSQIRVVWGGPARCGDAAGARQDTDVMRAESPGVLRFDRIIAAAGVDQLARSIARYGKPLPESPSHDGIEDGGATGGVVYYCHQGTWVTIPGGE